MRFEEVFLLLTRNRQERAHRASHWVGEMEEIADTFPNLGLPPQILEGAATMHRLVEHMELGAETPEARQRGQMLEEVTAILAATLPKETC